MVSSCLYWRFKKFPQNDVRSTNLSGISIGLENLNVKHTRKGTTRTDEQSLARRLSESMGLGKPIKGVDK